MNKKKYPVVNIGTTSILTVFVILLSLIHI